jgi:hypothetical protein
VPQTLLSPRRRSVMYFSISTSTLFPHHTCLVAVSTRCSSVQNGVHLCVRPSSYAIEPGSKFGTDRFIPSPRNPRNFRGVVVRGGRRRGLVDFVSDFRCDCKSRGRIFQEDGYRSCSSCVIRRLLHVSFVLNRVSVGASYVIGGFGCSCQSSNRQKGLSIMHHAVLHLAICVTDTVQAAARRQAQPGMDVHIIAAGTAEMTFSDKDADVGHRVKCESAASTTKL